MAVADTTEREIGTAKQNLSFDQVSRSLEAAGYTSVRQHSDDANRFAAFDAEKSEVVMTINPETGMVEATEFVHEMDR